MSRPTVKIDLIEAGKTGYVKLAQVMQALPDENQAFNFEVTEKMTEAHWQRDQNLRDVLIHLYEWHQLLLNWVNANQNGETQPFLPAPYNWKTYGQMNQAFWKKHQTTSRDDAKKRLNTSHSEVMALAETFSNDALFSKRYFPWTGSSSLGAYFVSATSSHYDWAMKKLRKQIKANR
ncbi:ClbS/DfsB family four-helix bundle protein [Pseudolactococcus reticulitermitis]|uniref:ClbS/DfsB family four-helix bundle protein n=1 Tax=Pseudolactococcus reticulitermitis TaxID=2025039 RepID=A0A224XCU5_9LACT|nr:ClbS/DfsB family four-helix bundle protein [Lactococcus reticulitermitis]GAX47441.1 hypothetical protein RsY01_1041 [Lactococcus reticulitermitis]